MNNYNPYKNFLLRMRRYFKEELNETYNKLCKYKILNFIFTHKMISIIILMFTISISIFLITLINYFIGINAYNNRLNGPKAENVSISNNFQMTYSGDINYGKIEGDGELILKTDTFKIIFNGTFDNIKSKVDNYVQIGEFIEGTISINALNSNITYIWNGDFKNGDLLKGSLKINNPTENETIIYEGVFENGKLQGSGKKTLKKNDKIRTVTGWFEDGILKEE